MNMRWWDVPLRLFIAVLVGGVIGVEREKKNRPAGMRTHVLVSVGAAVIAILECYIADYLHALNSGSVVINLGRMSAQVISGIGFLGAGTIIFSQRKVTGLTTGASIWSVGSLGLAAGMGYYGLAIVAAAIIISTLTVLQRLVRVNTLKNVEIKFVKRVETLSFINEYFSSHNIKVLNVDFHVDNQGEINEYTNVYALDLQGKTTYTKIVSDLSEYGNILAIRTRNT